MAKHEQLVQIYAESTAESPTACKDVRAACTRYLNDRAAGVWDFRTELPEFIITAIETLFCHQQGEDLSGRPLRGTPFLLQPFQLFII